MSVAASECPDPLENLKESMRDPKEILSVAGHKVVDLSRRTKADIQADLTELTDALRPHLEELVDILTVMDGSESVHPELREQMEDSVRALLQEAYETTSRAELFSMERVRQTGDTYRDLAEALA